jgi:hypothetical protein
VLQALELFPVGGDPPVALGGERDVGVRLLAHEAFSMPTVPTPVN